MRESGRKAWQLNCWSISVGLVGWETRSTEEGNVCFVYSFWTVCSFTIAWPLDSYVLCAVHIGESCAVSLDLMHDAHTCSASLSIFLSIVSIF